MNSDELTWNSQAPLEQQTGLARFVLEGLPQIENLVASAEGILQENTGDPSFDAYVSGDCRRVREQVRAIYEWIRKLGLTYRVEPWDSHHARQVIRYADAVLAKGYGCCLDLTLLLASALRHVGIYPLITVVGDTCGPTHAILGYWTEERVVRGSGDLPQPVLTWNILQKHLSQINFVECTDVAGGPSYAYDRAEQDALTHLPPNPGRKVWYAVDGRAGRKLGHSPLGK
jgi:hypothetical protein